MSRDAAIARAKAYFDSGAFREDLARRVALKTESQNPERTAVLGTYVEEEMRPALESMGFTCDIVWHERAKGPFLIAERIEDRSLPTVLGYGHGDVIRGLDDEWDEGLSPWERHRRPAAAPTHPRPWWPTSSSLSSLKPVSVARNSSGSGIDGQAIAPLDDNRTVPRLGAIQRADSGSGGPRRGAESDVKLHQEPDACRMSAL